MSKSLIEGASPAEELLLSFKAPPKEEPAAKPPKPAPKKKAAGSRAKMPKETEHRTRRVQLVLTPTLYDQLNEAAWNNRQSVNETIIQAVTEYLKRR